MFPYEIWIGVAMLGALIVYAISGGADFGVGVWDLFATGERKDQQRVVIVKAIAPIWEVHHIWLVLVVALLYVAFPLAFHAVYVSLFIPLMVVVVGLLLRGMAFLMRAYVIQSEWVHEFWRILFAISSMVVAVGVGVCIGGVSSGQIRVQVHTGLVVSDAYSGWWAPFPFMVGFLILALFAFLAAVYLIHETDDVSLKEDFRTRALIAGVGVFVLAWVSFALSAEGAPLIREGLWHRVWSIPFQGVTGMIATAALCALWLRWYGAARVLAVSQSVLMILGWGMAFFPYVVAPDLKFENAAAPDEVLQRVTIILGLGLLILLPSFWYVYRVFKWQKVEEDVEFFEDEVELVEIEEE
ncbi:MAG: cytochrome d ubiquinol oxidase subunit II [Candidatus Latescibacterota bacterium]